MHLIAQSSDDYGSIFIWTIGLIVLLAGGLGAIAWLRRRLSPNEDFHGEGFTMADLRQLHSSGKLSDEEFEAAKAQLIQNVHKATAARVRDYPDPLR